MWFFCTFLKNFNKNYWNWKPNFCQNFKFCFVLSKWRVRTSGFYWHLCQSGQSDINRDTNKSKTHFQSGKVLEHLIVFLFLTVLSWPSDRNIPPFLVVALQAEEVGKIFLMGSHSDSEIKTWLNIFYTSSTVKLKNNWLELGFVWWCI